MNSSSASVCAVAFAAAALSLSAATGPAEWAPVSTNAIAAWKDSHKAPRAVVADKAAHRVTFLAEATGLAAGATSEFFVCGPLSDRAYETSFMSIAAPEDVIAAIESVGVPAGIPADDRRARLWPLGERLALGLRTTDGRELPFADLLADAQVGNPDADPVDFSVLFTGGARLADGAPVAATNIPCALFATYNHPPSPLQFAAPLDQSVAYGRFVVKNPVKAGELVEISLAWDGVRRVRDWLVSVGPGSVEIASRSGERLFEGRFEDAAAFMRDAAGKGTVYAEVAFRPEVRVADAARYAKFFDAVDGKGLRVNGRAAGQVFVKGYLPKEEWRDRARRMAQPFEVRVGADGLRTFTFVEEDWSGEGLDPVLKPRMKEFKEFSELPALVASTGRQGEKMFTMFVYLPSDSPVGPALEAARALDGRVTTVYVFSGL